jgi:lysophospholipase L1-like esterase
VKRELELVAGYSDRRLWWRWKGGQWGCTGQMRSDWLLANIDGWQKKMNPEASVILFGTNDLVGICPPEYTENMAAAVRRMLADGTVPMLTTVPPASGRAALAREYWLALLSIAHAFKIPVIDYYSEILRRRPEDWDGRLPKLIEAGRFGLISRDGVHPSHPGKYAFDFSEEALNNNGYVLRDYLTIRKYYEVITKVLRPERE